MIGHYWVASDQVSLDLVPHFYVLGFFLQELSWEDRLSDDGLLANRTLCLGVQMDDIVMLGCGCDSCLENLLVLWMVTPRMGVDVMCFHILSINGASNCRVSVGMPIGMKSWFPKVCSYS